MTRSYISRCSLMMFWKIGLSVEFVGRTQVTSKAKSPTIIRKPTLGTDVLMKRIEDVMKARLYLLSRYADNDTIVFDVQR